MSATKPREDSTSEQDAPKAPGAPKAPPHPQPRHGPRELDDPGSRRGTTSIIQSFNYAFEGVIWTLRSQRNMRIHFAVAAIVLVLAVAYDVSKLELIALLLAIAFVLIAEMVNTAIEATIDLSTPSFDPLAKIAKDIAAGAVLIAAANAIAVGYLVLADRLARPSTRLVNSLGDAPINLTVIALVLTIIVVIAIKAITGTGTPLRGGLPSGHAALAFGCWAAITFIVTDHRIVISFAALIMALLVSQTRVEAEIHTPYEVVAGAVIGTLVTLILFQVFR
jgi:diacylglycerol kinase (ATP)